MCGIVGFITDKDQAVSWEMKKFITQGLYVDLLRGEDATGIMYGLHWPADGSIRHAGFVRHPGPSFVFLGMKDTKKVLEDMRDHRFVVGHNRAATIGSNKMSNTHPFQEKPITLVHNGTIQGTHRLPAGGTAKLNVDVDSHAICYNLAAHNVEEVVAQMEGGYALVWHDGRDDTVNIIRNSDRPMHFAQIKDRRTVMFASEGLMLQWLAARNNIKIGPMYSPKPGVLFTFHPEKTLSPVTRQLKMYSPPKYEGFGNWRRAANGVHYPDTKENDHPFVEQPATRRNFGARVAAVALGDMGVEYNKPCAFDPVKVAPMPVGDKVIVTGYLLPGGQTAIIYNVRQKVWQEDGDNVWKVLPIGIRELDGQEDMVVCIYAGVDYEKSLEAMRSSEKEEPATDNGPYTDEIGLYPGPNGAFIDLTTFKNLVMGGCITCGKELLPEIADEIMWHSNDLPTCPTCVGDYHLNKSSAPAKDDHFSDDDWDEYGAFGLH